MTDGMSVSGRENAVTKSKFSNNFILTLIVLIAVISLEFFGEIGIIISALILFAFGFIHLFSNRMINKILVGIIPILLAGFSALIAFGYGFNFLDFLLINYYSVFSIKTVVIFLVLVYFIFIGRKLENYGAVAVNAGKAAVSYGWKFSISRFGIWIILIALAYFLEWYELTSFYASIVITIVMVIFGLVFLVRNGALNKIVGLGALILSTPGILSLLEIESGANIFYLFYPGAILRYVFLAVILFFVFFRHKNWAQAQV